MTKQGKLTDPLSDVDPIMEEAFVEDFEAIESDKSVEGGESSATQVSKIKLPDLQQAPSGQSLNQDLFEDIKINVSVELGRCQLSLKDILHLKEGAIVELNRLVGEPIDLVVNNQVVAQGEVVAVNQLYGFRVTKILAKYEG
ncbi:MAG: flagellar motor switch protein FliN [bacterium]